MCQVMLSNLACSCLSTEFALYSSQPLLYLSQIPYLLVEAVRSIFWGLLQSYLILLSLCQYSGSLSQCKAVQRLRVPCKGLTIEYQESHLSLMRAKYPAQRFHLYCLVWHLTKALMHSGKSNDNLQSSYLLGFELCMQNF